MNMIIASVKEKEQCVLWFHETRSAITFQPNFKKEYRRPPPLPPRVLNASKTGMTNLKTLAAFVIVKELAEQIQVMTLCVPRFDGVQGNQFAKLLNMY